MERKCIDFEYEGKTFDGYLCGNPSAALIVLLNFEKQGSEIVGLIEKERADFNLIEVTGLRWQDELTPWKHPPVYRGDKGYEGEGYAFMRILTSLILPILLKQFELQPKTIAIAGYSLAGLFSLYCASRSNAFDAAISASGSVWFDGFVDFIRDQGVSQRTKYIYLSLGEGESQTKNATISTVGDKTKELHEFYLTQGIKTDLVWNPGGHFDNETTRIADGILAFLRSVAA